MQQTAAPAVFPRAKSFPYLGIALDMRIDPLRYFLKLYREHGSVFEVKLLGRPIVVMAGLEANLFLSKHGEDHFGSENLFGGLARELGSEAFLVAMDGVPHRHQRKIQRRGFSRETMQSNLAAVMAITQEYVDQWSPGTVLPIFPTMQRIVTDQLGVLIGGRKCGDYFDDLWVLLNTSMKVHILKTHPKFYLSLPRFVRAKQRVKAFSREVMDWHRQNPPVDREPRLVDDLIAAVDENGKPYSDDTVMTGIAGAYFAGMDTVASTLSFMLYAILSQPELTARLQAEIDAVFENGGLTPEALRKMEVLHNAALETLRVYTVTPFTPRTVVKAFDFEGYHFPVGTEVYIANAIPHFLPEYFPNPETFDVDRYERPDHAKTPGAFAPFSLGAHTCLGAGAAEVQMMTLIATLLRTVNLTLEPAATPVTIYANPLPNPGRKFAFRVVSKRKPI
ncbi:MAG: cytochrome P450 [Anaerolinea sp.]|nr:cytochrome P450 [Anaerolinea sp.]